MKLSKRLTGLFGAACCMCAAWSSGAADVAASDDAGRVERFAAGELRRYLDEAAESGWLAHWRFRLATAEEVERQPDRYPVRLTGLLGELKPEGYLWLADDGNFYIVGQNPRGVLNGVYAFLDQKLGLKWPEPGVEARPERPAAPDLAGIAETSNPAFPYRGIAIHGRCEAEFFAELVDWLAKNRLTGIQLFNNHYNNLRAGALDMLLDRDMFLNIGGHSREYFYPGERYFDEAPETFMLKDGKRDPEQLCYSNFDSIPAYARAIVDYAAANPEVKMIGVWPSDGWGYCACEACQVRSKTDTLLDYYNHLAASVAEQRPDLRLEFLSYISYTTPPETVETYPTLVPTYCEYTTRSQFHPITEDYMENARHRQELEGWLASAEAVTIFSYYGDDCIKRYLYNPVIDVIAADFRHYEEIGLAGHFLLLTNPQSWWSNAPHLYAYSRAIWDPQHVEVEAMTRDYYQACYGPAAGAMRKHAEACRALFDHRFSPEVTGEDVILYLNFPGCENSDESAVMAQLADKMAAIRAALAEAAVLQPEARVRQRIEKLQADADYVELVFKMVYKLEKYRKTGDPADAEAVLRFAHAQHANDVVFSDDRIGYVTANSQANYCMAEALQLPPYGITAQWAMSYPIPAEAGMPFGFNGPAKITALPEVLQEAIMIYAYSGNHNSALKITLDGLTPERYTVWAAVPAGAEKALQAAGFEATAFRLPISRDGVAAELPLWKKAAAPSHVEVDPGMPDACWGVFLTRP